MDSNLRQKKRRQDKDSNKNRSRCKNQKLEELFSTGEGKEGVSSQARLPSGHQSQEGPMCDADRAYLLTKLRSITRSKSCIEELSRWMLARPESQVKVVLTMWLDELRLVSKDQLLPLLYLANAVMLNNTNRSNGNGPGGGEASYKLFRKGFMKVMPYAVKFVARDFSEIAQSRVIKLFGLWLCKKIAPQEQIENISEVYLETWNTNQVINPDEYEDEDIPPNLLAEEESDDIEIKSTNADDNANTNVSPNSSCDSTYYPDGSPYEPIDSYEDDISKKDELKKFFASASCTQLNDLNTESLLSIIRSEPDMRRLFLQKVPHHSLLEVNLRPLEVDRANCPKEQDLIALVESLCQLPSEDYDSRDMHNNFPDEFCVPMKALKLCTDSWSTNELSSSVKNALAILCIYLKRLDVEMGVRADATGKLQAFIKAQKKKLFVAEDVLKEEQLLHGEMEEKLLALKTYVDSLSLSNSTQLHSSSYNKLPTVEDLFVKNDTKSE